jgi:ferredoxin
MKVHVDMSKCQSYGNCAQDAPGRYALDDWGYVVLIDGGDVPPGEEEEARKGAAACPSGALAIEE